MIVERIKQANIVALKEKNTIARSIYSVVLNRIKLAEIEKRTLNQEVTDVDVILIIQKAIKELEEERENYKKINNLKEAEIISIEIDVLKQYLPQMLSEEEICNIINSLNDRSVPNVMKHFKANYNGKCDMRQVSEILKRL